MEENEKNARPPQIDLEISNINSVASTFTSPIAYHVESSPSEDGKMEIDINTVKEVVTGLYHK
jgi:hypothetical protein